MLSCSICGVSTVFIDKDGHICDTCKKRYEELIKYYSKESYDYFQKYDLKNTPDNVRMRLYSYFDFFRVGMVNEKQRLEEYLERKRESIEKRKSIDCFESRVQFVPMVGFDFTYDDIYKYTEDGTITWQVSLKDCYKRGGLQIVYYSDVMTVLVIKGERTKIQSGYIRYNKNKQEKLSPQHISNLLKLIGKANPAISGKSVLEQIGNTYLEKSFIDMNKLQNINTSKMEELKNKIKDYWQTEKFYSDAEIGELLEKEAKRKYWAQHYADERELKRLIKSQPYDLKPSGCSGGLCMPK